MASSIHDPLKGDGREFRLLVLEPSVDRLAPVRCKLDRACLDDGDVKYTALSYTWGDPLATTPIFVNETEVQVTLNLEAVLRHVRQVSCAVVLWVDSICINQEDVAEKNVQVQMMKDIYSDAELVIAWLGSSGEDSDLAMELLGKPLTEWEASRRSPDRLEEWEENENVIYVNIGEEEDDVSAGSHEGDLINPSSQSAASIPDATTPGLKSSSPAALTNSGVSSALPLFDEQHEDEHHITDQSDNSSTRQATDSGDPAVSGGVDGYAPYDLWPVIPRLTKRETLAILRLLSRSWWSRIWVVQEVMLAKQVVFKCGDAEVPGHQMSSWSTAGLDALRALCDDHDFTGHISDATFLLHGLNGETEKTENSVELLSSYGMRQASRPHDHIYGVLGIMPAKDRMLLGAPDYGCSAEDFFSDVAAKLIVEYNSLELLLAAGLPAPSKEASSTKTDLPSWVPDWTRPLSTSLHRNVGEDGGLGSFSGPVFHISEDLKELTVEGLQFDIVESVKPIPAVARGKVPIWPDDLMTEGCATYDERAPLLQRIIIAMLLDNTHLERLESYDGFKFMAAFLRELKEYRVSPDHDEESKYDLIAGFLRWTGETRDGREDWEILESVFSPENARQFCGMSYHWSTVAHRRYYRIYTVMRNGMYGTAGFSMFRTCKGSFGIMQTSAVAAGDILCVVPSCPMPLALRKVESSKYLLVGPTGQIVETMHGEVAQAAENGEIAWEKFTLV